MAQQQVVWKYLPYDNKSDAETNSRSDARDRGAGDAADDVTEFWWSPRPNSGNNKVALAIKDSETDSLTQSEQDSLLTETEASDQGYDTK